MAVRGRPTKYQKKHCKMLLDHMSKGLSFKVFAPSIGVARSTIYEWLELHKEFRDTKKEADAYCQLFWEKLGVGGIAGRVKGFNASGWIYNMKCRFPEDFQETKQEDDRANVDIKLSYDPGEE